MVGMLPWKISPVEPSSVMTSPAPSVTPPSRTLPSANSSAPQPATQHLPMPRATTAACDVMPPSAVRMPRAACMPWMSSGEVSRRTRITSTPCAARSSAASALNTI